MVNFINTMDPRIMRSGQINLDNWVGTLFKAARASKGEQKVKYAMSLQSLVSFIGREKYMEMLGLLMTNPQAVEELKEQGRKEIDRFGRIKKLFSKEK